eukprot:GHVT01008482.1.p2 GENE.GHVT01008482.1~~GHVT01008482.1.p2  ORF type:complete len:101 (+),score=22.51 GHVT01008482.1:296-598(+)
MLGWNFHGKLRGTPSTHPPVRRGHSSIQPVPPPFHRPAPSSHSVPASAAPSSPCHCNAKIFSRSLPRKATREADSIHHQVGNCRKAKLVFVWEALLLTLL